jgi:hypothetical protein
MLMGAAHGHPRSQGGVIRAPLTRGSRSCERIHARVQRNSRTNWRFTGKIARAAAK